MNNKKKLFLIHETQNKFGQRKLFPREKFSVPPYNMHIARWICKDNDVLSICTYTYITVVYIGNFKVQRDITPTKFRQSKFPGYMHNRILCPYYLPSFMEFCSVVSEELCWQAASEVYFGKLLSSKGHTCNSHKISW